MPQLDDGGYRYEKIHCFRRVQALERWLHYAHHRHGSLIDRDGAADHAWIQGKTLFPVAIRENNDAGPAWSIIFRENRPADQRLRSQAFEIVA